MKNIIWKKPDGFYAITFLADDLMKPQEPFDPGEVDEGEEQPSPPPLVPEDSETHAQHLQERGDIDASWKIEALDADDYTKYTLAPPSPLIQIKRLENSITPEMLFQASIGSKNIIESGEYSGFTATEAIASVLAKVAILRKT